MTNRNAEGCTMSEDNENVQRMWQQFYGPNLGYIQEQYDIYVQNAEAVSPQYRELFAQLGAPPRLESIGMKAPAGARELTQNPGETNSVDTRLLKKAIAAGQLAWNIRAFGHLAANIDPLGLSPKASSK